ncbi:YHS domain-containing (seleno)protein [uncultured Tateyamaria sp.]|uniref:YHS domain-containing (seleno)protein n=1 Tax=uncultured Tateyamaria sp. TaxID=455651 RepID=UPI002616A7F0|nr:YHS domain-containing (seleno)protein [uncultured Tateyamaria sp.]
MRLDKARRRFLALAFAATVAGLPAGAGELLNTDENNLALSGYDPVAYFTEARPVVGDPNISVDWQDARWQFSSDTHRAMFEEDPDKYAPRYGGFCAGGMSLGRKSDIDPEAWMIVDGQLFLGGSEGAITYMKKDTAGKIEKANENWTSIGVTN